MHLGFRLAGTFFLENVPAKLRPRLSSAIASRFFLQLAFVCGTDLLGAIGAKYFAIKVLKPTPPDNVSQP